MVSQMIHCFINFKTFLSTKPINTIKNVFMVSWWICLIYYYYGLLYFIHNKFLNISITDICFHIVLQNKPKIEHNIIEICLLASQTNVCQHFIVLQIFILCNNCYIWSRSTNCTQIWNIMYLYSIWVYLYHQQLSPCNCLCAQRLQRHQASPLWYRPRTSQGTTNDKIHQDYDKYQPGLQYCHPAISTNVWTIMFVSPGHQTNPVEHSIVVWQPLPIPTFDQWPDQHTESLDTNMVATQ